MSSAEVEIHLSDKEETFTIRVKLEDESTSHQVLNAQVAALVSSFIDQVGKNIK